MDASRTRLDHRARSGRTALGGAVLLLALLTLPATALAANQFGLTFAGQAAGMKCHSATTGPYAAGTYATTAHFLFERGANIVHSNQHTLDPSGGTFFMRIEFELDGLPERLEPFRHAFDALAKRWYTGLVALRARVSLRRNMAWRWRSGEGAGTRSRGCGMGRPSASAM